VNIATRRALSLSFRSLAGSAALSETGALGLLASGREAVVAAAFRSGRLRRAPRILSIRETSRFYLIREGSRF
jgi:hypothetical protein